MALKLIASAATIDLTGVVAAEISGTATISTINGMHDGEVKWLYPAGAFAFTTGGNIAVAVTAVVGRPFPITSRNSTIYAPSAASPAPFDATYVTLTADATLSNERTLTGESTVISITDGGAGAAVTVGVAANGVTDAKLRQGGAASVIGRSAGSTGNVADIAASADAQFLGRHSGALGFATLASGDVPDVALTSNVALKNAINIFSVEQIFGALTALTLGGQAAENGAKYQFKFHNEQLSLAGVTTKDTVSTVLDSFSLLLPPLFFISTTISGGGVTTIRMGDAVTTDRFVSDNLNLTAGTGFVGQNIWQGGVSSDQNGPWQASGAALRITLDAAPTQGVIRVVTCNLVATAPTS